MSRMKQRRAANRAAKRGKNALHDAADALSPVIDNAADVIVPLAMDAKQRIVPLVDGAKKQIKPLTVQVRDKVTPLAMDATGRIVPAAENVGDWFDDVTKDARKQIEPLMKNAKKTLEKDVIKPAKSLWGDVLDSDYLSEVQSRGAATAAAMRGDLRLPVRQDPGRQRTGMWWKIPLGLAAVGGLAYLVRQFLTSKDNDWTFQEPSRPDVQPAHGRREDPKPADLDESVAPARAAESDPAADMVDEGGPAEGITAETTAEDSSFEQNYGEGSYVGSEPPEGFTVKGNLRSMKYHTTDASNYERTNADVWFNSDEAAEAAGFTRAQR